MREELDRSKSKLKMDNVPAPYFIEYRLSDIDEYDAEAAFGGLREDQRFHARSVRIVVRVGDYKQDSYFGPGVGAAAFAPLDDNPVALRWQLWAATDQAYKTASQALAMKKAALNQFTSSQPFDDFSKSAPLVSIEPIAKLDFDSKPWKDILEKSSALFRTDPKIQSLITSLRFRAVNEYYVNTEGTVTRSGHTVYFLNAAGSTQAADGMQLERSPYYSAASLKELAHWRRVSCERRKTRGHIENPPGCAGRWRGLSRTRDFWARCSLRPLLWPRRPEPFGQPSQTGRFFSHNRRIRI